MSRQREKPTVDEANTKASRIECVCEVSMSPPVWYITSITWNDVWPSCVGLPPNDIPDCTGATCTYSRVAENNLPPEWSVLDTKWGNAQAEPVSTLLTIHL